MKASPSQPTQSLTTLLALAFVSLSVMLLAIAGAIGLYTNLRTYQDGLAAQQEFIAQEAAQAVRSFVQERFVTMETAVDFANPTTASEQDLETFMGGLVGSHPAFQQISLLNNEGRSLAELASRTGGLSEQFLALHSEALAQTTTGTRYLSEVYVDVDTADPLTTIAIPIKNALGDTQGALIAEIDLKFMWDLVGQLAVGETGYVYVVDEHGDLLAYRDTARVLAGENVSEIGEVAEFIENPTALGDITPEAVEYIGLDGNPVLGVYVPLGAPAWAVVIELPTDEAYAPIVQSSITAVGLILVMAVLAGLVGVFIARRLAVPLIALTDTATRIAGGETRLQAKGGGAREIATLADAFNQMTAQLRDLIGSLEQRVTDRTRDLNIVAEVGTAAATILESKRLLQTVVDLTKERFNLYHSHIYLLDEASQNLVLAAGAGEPGRQMVAEGRSIPLNREQSLVARAARERRGVTVNDVTQAPDFLPNPLLPNTRSELAVPILVGDNLIGVFDVQSDVIGRFTESDISVQTTLASQLATSIQNVRLFERARAEAQLEAAVNAIGQKVQAATTLEDTLQTAIREIGLALGASRVSIQVGTRQNGERPTQQN